MYAYEDWLRGANEENIFGGPVEDVAKDVLNRVSEIPAESIAAIAR